MSNLQQITSPPQSGAEIVVNENFIALEHHAVYGKNAATTSGLVWGYLPGRWGGFSNAGGTHTLTGSTTNYIVVAIATGVETVSTANTNWNDTTNYARVYKLTTSSTVVTGIEDHRAGPGGVHGGVAGGAGSGTVTSVAQTVPAFLSVAGSPITGAGTLAITLSGTALPVANGGTGDTSLTAYAPIFGGTTSTGAAQSGAVGTAGQVLTSNGAGALATFQSGTGGARVIQAAVSDESLAITTGTAKLTFRMPYAMTLTTARASLAVASSSGLPTVDIKMNGTSIFSTLISIDATERTSTTAATPPVITTTALTDDAEITVDITVAGTGAKGLKVSLIGTA